MPQLSLAFVILAVAVVKHGFMGSFMGVAFCIGSMSWSAWTPRLHQNCFLSSSIGDHFGWYHHR